MTVIWQGTVSSPYAGASVVTFTLDPATAAVTEATSSGPVRFTPDEGYVPLNGSFSSVLTFTPGDLPADPAAAWAAAAASLVILDPAKTYTMTITQT